MNVIEPKDLMPVISWLRNGCNPLEAVKELEILLGKIPVVPDPKQLGDHKSAAYILGWNECRSAMLNSLRGTK